MGDALLLSASFDLMRVVETLAGTGLLLRPSINRPTGRENRPVITRPEKDHAGICSNMSVLLNSQPLIHISNGLPKGAGTSLLVVSCCVFSFYQWQLYKSDYTRR